MFRSTSLSCLPLSSSAQTRHCLACSVKDCRSITGSSQKPPRPIYGTVPNRKFAVLVNSFFALSARRRPQYCKLSILSPALAALHSLRNRRQRPSPGGPTLACSAASVARLAAPAHWAALVPLVFPRLPGTSPGGGDRVNGAQRHRAEEDCPDAVHAGCSNDAGPCSRIRAAGRIVSSGCSISGVGLYAAQMRVHQPGTD